MQWWSKSKVLNKEGGKLVSRNSFLTIQKYSFEGHKNIREMRKILLSLFAALAFVACQMPEQGGDAKTNENEFQFLSEQFADLKIVRYQIPGWEKLSLQQKKLVYFLSQSGYAGRDIIWDQNYRHNLEIRDVLEAIYTESSVKEGADWDAFKTYTKRVWFSNGIHHHYSMNKIPANFSEAFFDQQLAELELNISDEAKQAIFDPEFDAKKVNLDTEKGLVKGSAVNFFAPDITEEEVDAFYAELIDKTNPEPISYGLNSRLVRTEDGSLKEDVYKVGGLYGPALEQVNFWLAKAKEVAENEQQAKAFELLISYFQTGDLKTWDDFNIEWVKAKGDIDFIHGFVEVYNDPKGFRGSFESIVEITDFDASARMQVLQENVQWFEDNSSIMPEHKKANVTGVTYKVVNVASESGDASPSTPIGVNLPNSNWIRSKHGSKSVSLGNIVAAYDGASGEGFLDEFGFDEMRNERARKHSKLGSKLHTALHEVVGHASGIINPGVGTPKETLKNYASTLEEARADLVALYFLMNDKLVELGLVESLEVGKAEYDSYILNGMLAQLRRLEAGEDIEEAHMRNRQLVAAWSFEKGAEEGVIEKVVKDGKTHFVVRDYIKLQHIFGELLKEIQRIKSEGDYEAGRNLVEGYGVKVDQALHKEVLERAETLKSAPYGGFINAKLVPVMEEGAIVDVKVTYPDSFDQQMLDYSKNFHFLKN
ncbi:MAG: dipeptidyl-peptidase-3 [Sphingobacteriales bacterium]|jgi:dipeptidyl-peptidase-3